jgi:hypothetical protein
MGKSRVIVLIAAVALLAAGCSSGKPAAVPKPSSSAPAAAVKEPCALLSGDAVAKAVSLKQVTGAPGPDENSAANGGKAKTCVYSGDGKRVGALAVTRYEGKKFKPAEMITSIKASHAGAVDVAGIGAAAVYFIVTGKEATLVAAKIVQGVPTLVNYAGPEKMTSEMMTPLVKQAIDTI